MAHNDKMRNKPIPKSKKPNEIKFIDRNESVPEEVIGSINNEEIGQDMTVITENSPDNIPDSIPDSIPDTIMDDPVPVKNTFLIQDKRGEDMGINRDDLLERIKAKRKGQGPAPIALGPAEPAPIALEPATLEPAAPIPLEPA